MKTRRFPPGRTLAPPRPPCCPALRQRRGQLSTAALRHSSTPLAETSGARSPISNCPPPSARYHGGLAMPMGPSGNWRHNYLWAPLPRPHPRNDRDPLSRRPQLDLRPRRRRRPLHDGALPHPGSNRKDRRYLPPALPPLACRRQPPRIRQVHGLSWRDRFQAPRRVRQALFYQYTLDSNNRVIRVTDPAGHFIQLNYGPVGNFTTAFVECMPNLNPSGRFRRIGQRRRWRQLGLRPRCNPSSPSATSTKCRLRLRRRRLQRLRPSHDPRWRHLDPPDRSRAGRPFVIAIKVRPSSVAPPPSPPSSPSTSSTKALVKRRRPCPAFSASTLPHLPRAQHGLPGRRRRARPHTTVLRRRIRHVRSETSIQRTWEFGAILPHGSRRDQALPPRLRDRRAGPRHHLHPRRRRTPPPRRPSRRQPRDMDLHTGTLAPLPNGG